jgi:tRNA pseudouridine55 synthase
MLEFFDETTKKYRATIELGTETITYDAEGPVIAQHEVSHITRTHIEQALEQFRGVTHQRPPMYSAIKHQGTPLYRLARRGVEVERPERRVEVYNLEITQWDSPYLEIRAEVGRGLYLRSLAHDLGNVLGCGAYEGLCVA